MTGRLFRLLGLAVGLALNPAIATAQQQGDPDFNFRPAAPAFESGTGPVVCVDEAHNNFHTAEGRYRPFAELLRADGYRVRRSTEKFTEEALAHCRLLVIANAIGDGNSASWAFPHPSAFSRNEIEVLYRWIQNGGSLLLFVDHAPMPGAAAALMAVLGASPMDAYADNAPGGTPDVFSRDSGLLREHPITLGRDESEGVAGVATFTGHAFLAAPEFTPLIVFGPEATAFIDLGPNLPSVARSQNPRIPIAGWLHGAARQLARGRVVLLGEAAMCTAQLAGAAGRPMGMNHPDAGQNPQFCLNTVRWLTEVIG